MWVEPEEFAQFYDLLYPLPLSLLLILLRMGVTRTVFRPLASRLGLRSRADKPQLTDNALLEAVHTRRREPSHQELTKISEQCGMTVIQVRIFVDSGSERSSRSDIVCLSSTSLSSLEHLHLPGTDFLYLYYCRKCRSLQYFFLFRLNAGCDEGECPTFPTEFRSSVRLAGGVCSTQ